MDEKNRGKELRIKMNTKLLRQKILDLAIRGKLTQQLKSDGTARELLKDIAEAKSKKSGVILSGARSAKSKDPEQIVPLDKSEAPFEIPENWEWVRLGNVCFVTKLAGFEYSDYIVNNLVEDGIPLFKGSTARSAFACHLSPIFIEEAVKAGKLLKVG